MDEEKERKMYVVTQKCSRKGIIYADSLEQAQALVNASVVRFDTYDIKTESISEFNTLKSNEEVEKDESDTSVKNPY